MYTVYKKNNKKKQSSTDKAMQKPQQLHLQTFVFVSTVRALLILHEQSCWISLPGVF